MVELTQDQKRNLTKYIVSFKEFLKTDEAQKWKAEREEKIALTRQFLGKENIDSLTEEGVRAVIKSLWATQIWRKKDVKANKILADNGLPKLREEFKQLVYGSESIDKRFDRFRRNVKGLGIASITEILGFAFPDTYCLWTEKLRRVIPFLGLESLLPDRAFKYFTYDGKNYVECVEFLELIANELSANGVEHSDFLGVDYFLYYIYDKYGVKAISKKLKKGISVISAPVSKMEHEDLVKALATIGKIFGYQVSTKPAVNDLRPSHMQLKIKVKELDLAWKTGTFSWIPVEVQVHGSIESLLTSFDFVQQWSDKMIVVVTGDKDKEIIDEFARNKPGFPHHKLVYLYPNEIEEATKNTMKLLDLKQKIFG